MKYVDPKVDIAFKKIFGDESRKHVLISLLNAVMGKDIVEVEILNPYQVPKLPELKFTILDIKAKDRLGREFIVEMQANPYKYFDKRALDYVSRAYVNQLQGGDDYDKHQPVYFVGVLNFNYFNSDHYLSRHLILDAKTLEQEIRDFEFYFIQLKMFNKSPGDLETNLDKWTYFLKEINKLEKLPEELANDSTIFEAATTANQATWTKEEIEAYEHGLREENREIKMIEQLAEKEKALKTKEKALKTKEEALKKSEDTLKKSIHLLLGLKQSIPEISKALNVSESEIERLI